MSELDCSLHLQSTSIGSESDMNSISFSTDRTADKIADASEVSDSDKQPDKVTLESEPVSEVGEASDTAGAEVKKKKHRRGKPKKRKWKPYNKLSWEERRELEEWEAKRAHRIRAKRFAHGQPVAPYNTTQFLMEDHYVQEPDYNRKPNGHRHRENSNSNDTSDEFYSSPEGEEDFLQKQFTEAYEDVHVERLNSMPKSELVQEYMIMEERYEELEKRLEATRGKMTQVRTVDSEVQTSSALYTDDDQTLNVNSFHEKIRKLQDENKKLEKENEVLRIMIQSKS